LVVLVRFGYLAVSNTFAALRLFPMGSREKETEILALRHQLRVLQRQLGSERVRFEPADRALLAALLGTLPRRTLRQQMLIIVNVTCALSLNGTSITTTVNAAISRRDGTAGTLRRLERDPLPCPSRPNPPPTSPWRTNQ